MFDRTPSFGAGTERATTWLMALLCAACSHRPVPEGGDSEDPSFGSSTNIPPASQETSGTIGAPGATTGATSPESTDGDAEPGTSGPDGTGTTAEEDATTGGEQDDALIPAMPGPDPPPAPDPRCGDGVLDPGEGCDDGNTVHGDGCLPDCTPGLGTRLPPVWTQDPPSWAGHLGLLDGALLGSAAGALVVGGQTYEGPVRLELVPLADGGPAPWSHVGWDKRIFDAMAIAGNGDIITAGFDADGVPQHLWLARFSPTGDLLWSVLHERPSGVHNFFDFEIDISPNGDIVGRVESGVLVFDAAGTPRWTLPAPGVELPQDGTSVEYDSVTIDDLGRIYVARTHRGGTHAYVVLEALGPNADLLWQTGLNSVQYSSTGYPVVAVTPEGTLFVVVAHSDQASDLRAESMAAFDTDGALRWWRHLSVPYDVGNSTPALVVPAPWGGLFVVWNRNLDDHGDREMIRYNAEGRALYSLQQAMGWVNEFRPGPDGRYYSVETSEWEDDEGCVVTPHLP